MTLYHPENQHVPRETYDASKCVASYRRMRKQVRSAMPKDAQEGEMTSLFSCSKEPGCSEL